MIPQPRTAKQVKEDFLEKNPKLTEIKDKTPSVGEFYNINDDDDEVWIMQCPKGTDLSILKRQKLKLPGRSTQNDFETIAVEYAQPVQHAFGHKNRKGHNSIKVLPVRGSIVLRSRLNAFTPPEEIQTEGQSTRVPMPTGIKERHPLHGVNYEAMVQINEDIAERLKRADKVSPAKVSKKSKQKRAKAPGTIPVDADGEVELVLQKKVKKKKKKRTNSEVEEAVEVSPRKKKRNNTSNNLDEVAAELEWLNKL